MTLYYNYSTGCWIHSNSKPFCFAVFLFPETCKYRILYFGTYADFLMMRGFYLLHCKKYMVSCYCDNAKEYTLYGNFQAEI